MKSIWLGVVTILFSHSVSWAQPAKQICEISQLVKRRSSENITVFFKDEVLRQNSAQQSILIYPNHKVDANFSVEEVSNFEEAKKLIGSVLVSITRNGSLRRVELSRFSVASLGTGRLAGKTVAAGEGNITDRLQVAEPQTNLTVTCYQKTQQLKK